MKRLPSDTSEKCSKLPTMANRETFPPRGIKAWAKSEPSTQAV